MSALPPRRWVPASGHSSSDQRGWAHHSLNCVRYQLLSFSTHERTYATCGAHCTAEELGAPCRFCRLWHAHCQSFASGSARSQLPTGYRQKRAHRARRDSHQSQRQVGRTTVTNIGWMS
eukprot:scaffold2844_cov31-Tisochrysis_lutea.AAC.3